MYKWDEMTPKERDRLINKTFSITSDDFFDFAWESGTFNFSSNMSWTWKIIEKLQDKYHFSLIHEVGSHYSALFDECTENEDDADCVNCNANSMIDAICVGGLRVAGVDVEITLRE